MAGLAVALLVCGGVLALRPVTFGWFAYTASRSEGRLTDGSPPGAFLAP